ncbi:DUF1460 domain-containing protein [Mycolicibacterium brumae]|uniref:DUF1460 domain-containing protein n=1 Tax=Mycolicibacterium brumae TaxID=85968 RepID=UPI003520E935
MRSQSARPVPRALGLLAALALLAGLVTAPPSSADPEVSISAQSERILTGLLSTRNQMQAQSVSARAALLSADFLGTPYGANTLIGSATQPEQLVVELGRVDCFTFADYVEALKRGGDREEFLDGLVDVRYRDGVVDFAHRKHFFTDWAAVGPAVATDVTPSLGDGVVAVTKKLNQKDSGGTYLDGIPVVTRQVSYLPSNAVDAAVLGKLRTGDYLGAYATDGGLDVTHVGVYIDTPDGPMFRNASSLSGDRQVVDTPLTGYLATVPGIVVLRPVM